MEKQVVSILGSSGVNEIIDKSVGFLRKISPNKTVIFVYDPMFRIQNH